MAGETAVERTITALRTDIREGRLVPGQRLVIADLMEKLGVSAGPVREAIRRLTGEGLVDVVPNRGAIVRNYSPKEIVEIFEVRQAIEGLAARLAARNSGEQNYAELLSTELKRGKALVETQGTGYIQHNQKLHRLIYDIAGNELLRETAEQLTVPIYRMRYHQMMDSSYSRKSFREHDEIVRAILAGDEEKAEDLMRRHVGNSANAMISALQG